MLGGLDHVVLFVNDLPRATAFYRDVLGLPVVVDTPGFVGVLAGGQMIGLHPTETSGSDVGHGPIPYFQVTDMEAAMQALRSRGVRVHREPVTMPAGHIIATIHDSEGNSLGLAQQQAGGI